MDTNKILQSDVLDLLFEGRNKEYGAYELRSNYSKRLLMSLAGMLALSGCVIILNAFSVKPKAKEKVIMYEVPTVCPMFVEPPIVVEPPKLKPKPVNIETIGFTTPRIVDEDIKPNEELPDADKVENIKIGFANTPGENSIDIVAPPVPGESAGVIEKPKPHEQEPIFVAVQIEAEYPGGMQAWLRYLNKTLPKYYTKDLIEQDLRGRVVVRFIVDKEGNVSDVEGLEGPKELREAAVKVIRMSGKWTPAVQNGHKVKSYKKQPIIFELGQE